MKLKKIKGLKVMAFVFTHPGYWAKSAILCASLPTYLLRIYKPISDNI